MFIVHRKIEDNFCKLKKLFTLKLKNEIGY